MFKYILKRLVMLIPIILGISFLIFFVMSLSPGDPARIILGEYATQEDVEALREEMGLNDSLIVQYARYIFKAIRGDLGTSYQTGQPVIREILERFPFTFKLAIGAVMIAVVLGIPIGIISAVKQYSWIDNLSMVVSMILTSMPGFWYGLMLMIIFALNLRWFPSTGASSFKHYVLPCITLSCNTFALMIRTTRSTMLEEIRQDYVRTAKAKGARAMRVIAKHSLRNALLPVITVAGMQFGILLGGAVVIESVFSIPGLGTYVVNAVKLKDTPSVTAAIMFIGVIGGVVNLIVDVLYTYIDPRLKSRYVKPKAVSRSEKEAA
ncbi:MAG: ABC transporter permease [Oscillospiraceae bacterium]|nr:ABC transporter permease [Oscillospiraceae bacterium]MBR3474784.1 ABC transporter permease [Oscillospiraceae bacterium]